MCSLCFLPALYRLEDKHGSTRLVPLTALSEYNVYCLLNLISHSYKCNSVVDGVQIVLILSNDVTKVCNAESNWSACGQPYHQKDQNLKKITLYSVQSYYQFVRDRDQTRELLTNQGNQRNICFSYLYLFSSFCFNFLYYIPKVFLKVFSKNHRMFPIFPQLLF